MTKKEFVELQIGALEARMEGLADIIGRTPDTSEDSLKTQIALAYAGEIIACEHDYWKEQL